MEPRETLGKENLQIWDATPDCSDQSSSTYELTSISGTSADRKSKPKQQANYKYAPLPTKQSHNDTTTTTKEPNGLLMSAKQAISRGDKDQDNNNVAKWRPFWLRRPLLGLFCIFFFSCAVTLPVILHFSQKNEGLGEVREDLAQLWRFGPTAILTIIAVLWARVELQAMRYMPWVAIQPRAVGASYGMHALDYTSMLPPEVLINSLRNKHILVFLAVVCSILTKVMVILSASVFDLVSLKGEHSIDFQTLDSFDISTIPDLRSTTLSGRGLYSNISSSLVNISATTPYFHARALQDFGMNFPFGVAKQGAYQTFRQLSGETRGSTESPVTAIVGGLFPETKCIPLQSYTFNNVTEEDLKANNRSTPTISLQFEGCTQTDIRLNMSYVPTDANIARWTIGSATKSHERCSLLQAEYEQFYYVAEFWNTGRYSNFRPIQNLETAAGVLCSVGLRLYQVEIIDDGTSPLLRLSSNQDGTPVNTHFWSLLSESIPLNLGSWTLRTHSVPFGPITAWANFRKMTEQQLGVSLYENESLQQAVSNLTAAIGPFIAHYHFKQNQNGTITGKISKGTPRLQVNRGISIAMSVFFSISTLISAWMMFKSRDTFGAWSRNPATILGSMTIFSGKDQIGEPVFDEGQSIKDSWATSTYTPLALRTWLRLLFFFYALALVISLAVTLQISEASDGIATLHDGTPSLWWKSIPALVMYLVALYTASSDMAVRDLGILYNLATRPGSLQELDMSFIDMVGFKALYHSFRLNNVPIILTQILAISCGFLTTLSTLLFSPEPVPKITTGIALPLEDQFISRSHKDLQAMDNYKTTMDSVGALVLVKEKSNLTWPKNTYGDLLFPRFDINTIQGQDWDNDMSLRVELTAAKIFPTCHRVLDQDFSVNVNFTKTSTHMPNTNLTISRDITCANGTIIPISSSLTWNSSDGDFVYVARSLVSDDDHYGQMPCDPTSEYTKRQLPPWKMRDYFWASISIANHQLEHHSYWRCNYSYWEVPTTVTFVHSNGGPQIDFNNPPIPNDSKRRPWSSPISIVGLQDPFVLPGDSNIKLKTTTSMFRPFLEPFGSLKMEAFGDPSQEDRILENLHTLHGIAWGQLTSQLLRTNQSESAGRAVVDASLQDNKQERLVQSRPITIALLTITLLAIIINLWVLISTGLKKFLGKRLLLNMEFNGLAPLGSNSIAMMDSLLCGSNAVFRMPKGAYHKSLDELEDSFE